MSIWTGKDGYNASKEFVDRTEIALVGGKHSSGHANLLDHDGGPHKDNDEAVSWVKSKLNDPQDVLEIGCGYGRWSKTLEGMYQTYTGIDVTSKRIKYAKKKYKRPNVKFLLVKQNWNLARKYDVILCLKVIQHLVMEDAILVLQQINNHLSEDGMALLHEKDLGYFDEATAEKIYSQEDWPCHMIPKPIALLQTAVPELKWREDKHFILTK